MSPEPLRARDAWTAWRADCNRWLRYSESPSLAGKIAVLTIQGAWAAAEHRFSHWVRHGADVPGPLRIPLKAVSFAWHRLIEITTGISIAADARIGPGLYMGHFGGIVIGDGVVLGRDCNVGQGVTIGASGYGETLGSPVIGDEVHIMPGAKVFGKITVGDRARIGANAVVAKDVPPNVIASGVPATYRPDTSRHD